MVFTTRVILVWLCLCGVIPAMAQEKITAAAARLPQGLTLCGEPVPMNLEEVRERFEKEMLLTLWDRPQVLLWLKRSSRYLPFISQELKKAGLPDDLKYLAIVESALMPHAGSSRGAIGFWQLLPETARKYGLTVDDFIDQRRDIYLSTPAALSYLNALHTRFSSWPLALAAYNLGEGTVDAEIMEQKTRDYYQLYLPLETQRFIFRLLAIKLIIGDPKAYGFELAAEDFYKPLRFDTMDVDCFQETPIRLVAQAANTYFKMIKDLNPHLRGHYLQAGRHSLRLPPGGGDHFNERFQALVSAHSEERQQRIYVVQSGDTLSSIAEKFGVPLAALLIWNRIDMKKALQSGDRLVIYPREPLTEDP
ncbi:MAG: transglycosylase SLT domain-containing protein [Desulfatitalea sp.]